ncbi:MAG: hypothetical protein IT561_22095 [Alphaproteobacteria bacterium]|nr:hypothetical protein [Alphaproteobacteria bacterium]
MSPEDSALLDAILRRLLGGEAQAVADLDAFERRHADRLETVRTVAWGLVCVRDWTAGIVRPAFDPAAEATPVDDAGLDIVTCFIRLPPPPPTMTGGEMHPPMTLAERHGLIRDCLTAARRAAPAARRILISNDDTPLPGDLGADRVVRDAIYPQTLMGDRIAAYRRHVAEMPPDRAGAVFIDPDVVCCRSPAEAFATPFSLALTWRRSPLTMPINSGVVFARRNAAALWLLDRALDCYAAICAEPRIAAAFRRLFGRPLEAWYGDQVALAALARWRRFGAPVVKPRRFGVGATLGLLPCTRFNHAVDAAGTADIEDRVLIHFKGHAKDALAAFVRALPPPDGHGPSTAPRHPSNIS